MSILFISHRTADTGLAATLAKQLRSAGHLVWLDTWNITAGDSIPAAINGALASANYVIACFSGHGPGQWMSAEMWSAFARQLNGKPIKLIPVLLRGGALPAFLADLRPANLADDWDTGVAELLRAIK
jgi:hypothetical protein